MLKITTRVEDNIIVLELEGRLTGPWVKELRSFWESTTASDRTSSRVDLTSVTFIDQEGKDLLGELYCQGAHLVATGCLNKCIVESIMGSGSAEDAKGRQTKQDAGSA